MKQEQKESLLRQTRLSNWKRFDELSDMKERVDAGLSGHRPFILGVFDGQIENIGWISAHNVVEDDKEFLIEVQIPKVNKKDESIKVDGDSLTISGKRESEKEGKKKHRVERSY